MNPVDNEKVKAADNVLNFQVPETPETPEQAAAVSAGGPKSFLEIMREVAEKSDRERLRDAFAIAAIALVYPHAHDYAESVHSQNPQMEDSEELELLQAMRADAADSAYKLADAMLEARKK